MSKKGKLKIVLDIFFSEHYETRKVREREVQLVSSDGLAISTLRWLDYLADRRHDEEPFKMI